MNELDDALHERIKALCAEGDAAAKQWEFAQAIERYEAAWELLPEPKTNWNAATWILVAIGDARFRAREFTKAREALQTAMHCPGAIGNPFLHLRLGQVEFELGSMDRAGDELTSAYMGGGPKSSAERKPSISTTSRPSSRNQSTLLASFTDLSPRGNPPLVPPPRARTELLPTPGGRRALHQRVNRRPPSRRPFQTISPLICTRQTRAS